MELKEIKPLIEEQGRLANEFREKVDQELAELKALGTALPETKAALEAMNTRFDVIETKLNRPDLRPRPKDEKQAHPAEYTAFEKFLRFGLKGNAALDRMSPEEKTAFGELRTKAISQGTDSQGGFGSPEDFRAEVIVKIANIANIAGVGSLVNRQQTSRDVLRYPKVAYTTDDIDNSGIAITWEDESDSATETEFAMGSVAIPVFKERALLKIPRDLLEDSAVNVMDLTSRLLASAFAVEDDKQFSTGSGGKKPEGFMTNTDISTVNSGSAGAFTYNGIMDLVYNLPEQYAQGARFMTRRLSMGAIRKLKDGSGQPMWQPSLAAGQPSTLAGFPIHSNEHIAAIASAARAMIFGDFKVLYTVADRVGMTVQRLDEKYADTDHVGLIVRRRVGGAVTGAWGAKIQVLT